MMLECPKCKFVQPKDRYCANCGLDIDSYVPKPEAALSKFSKNTKLHLTLVVLVTLLLAGLIYQEEKDKILEHLKGRSQVATSADDADAAVAENDLNEPQAITDPSKEKSLSAMVATDKLQDDKSHNQNAPPSITEIRITFAEASSVFLQQLVTEGQILNETAQRRSFVVPQIQNLESLKKRDPEFKLLRGGQSFSLPINTPAILDFTHLSAETNEDVGLTLEINPDSVSENSIEFSMLGVLNLKDELGQNLVNQEINANYTFSKSSTLVLVGFLPRQRIRMEDTELFSNTPLAIYDSPLFISGITDFVIFIQLK